MDAKSKQASGGVEFPVISAAVFLGLDSKPRIPVCENFCILAWIDRDGANIQYFRRRRLGKRQHPQKNKQNTKTDFSNTHSCNHPHKFHLSLLIFASFRIGMHCYNSKQRVPSSRQKLKSSAELNLSLEDLPTD